MKTIAAVSRNLSVLKNKNNGIKLGKIIQIFRVKNNELQETLGWLKSFEYQDELFHFIEIENESDMDLDDNDYEIDFDDLEKEQLNKRGKIKNTVKKKIDISLLNVISKGGK
jgi:hypothetical protein